MASPKINFMHLSFGDLILSEFSQGGQVAHTFAPDETQAYASLNGELVGKIKIKDQKQWITIPVDAVEDRIQIVFRND